MDGDLRYAWPTDGAFHRGYVDGLQGRTKRTRQGEEYEDGYACGCGDAAPDAADRHVRAAMVLESRYGGDELAAVSEGFEMGYDDACGHFAYASPARLLGNVHAELAAALRENYLHGYAAGMSVLRQATPTGGSRLSRPDNTGGSRLSRPNDKAATSAALPPVAATSAALPQSKAVPHMAPLSREFNLPRHHPSRKSVMSRLDNRLIILFVTVVTFKRTTILANDAVHTCIVKAWQAISDWKVGRYVIMPDHLHFFCSPASYPPTDFHSWMRRWKAQVSRTFPLNLRMGGARLSRPNDKAATSAALPPAAATSAALPPAAATSAALPPVAATSAALPKRLDPIFQRDYWDRQLRVGESYSQKWQYFLENPVVKGYVVCPENWPYQGELNFLQWHERV